MTMMTMMTLYDHDDNDDDVDHDNHDDHILVLKLGIFPHKNIALAFVSRS